MFRAGIDGHQESTKGRMIKVCFRIVVIRRDDAFIARVERSKATKTKTKTNENKNNNGNGERSERREAKRKKVEEAKRNYIETPTDEHDVAKRER